MPESPSFDDEPSSSNGQAVTIEHKVNSSTNRSAGLIMGMTKPAMAIAGLLVMGGVGAAAFGWFQIPGLNDQIDALEAQVTALSNEVDRLTEENNRYETLNDMLNETVADFRNLTESLNSTVIELQDVADDLNQTNLELQEQVSQLTAQNLEYAQLNQDLNATATRLAEEVDFFEIAVANLILENGALSNTTEALQRVNAELGNLTDTQNQTLVEMATVLGDLASENDRLESLNNDLVTIVSFLNETSLDIDESLQQVTEFLADQIIANSVLLAESLENTYRQQIQNWDCDYRDYFREEPYGENYTMVITDLPTVLSYVDDRVLSDMCLDVDDFEAYLVNTYADSITSYRLIAGVTEYTTRALTYYFPDVDETGVTPQEWADASYSCRNLEDTYPPEDADVRK
eukprot:Nitzschia sp. Nitz4//scaffold10_size219509//133703//134911//NITZ4_001439-RA/size219509-processed-gene-0.340-mRNA-1//-1//CDS//3329532953//7612//frame0